MTNKQPFNTQPAIADGGGAENATLSANARKIMHERRGALQMFADYDRGLIDRDGKPTGKQKHTAK